MTLEESRRWCSAVMRAHAKSFFFSTRILPRHKRQAVEALYGLFRTADDIADEPGYDAAERLELLDEILRAVSCAARGEVACHEWFPAVADAFAKFPIDERDVVRLISACRDDVFARSVTTMQDLYDYSAAVAGTVGRASMAILGAADDDSLRRAERLGVAMQYTNVLRDVAEDRAMGRNYLPSEMFDGNATIGDVMERIAAQARTYYGEAIVLAGRVPNDGSRAALLMTGEIYGAILDRIEAGGYNPQLGRAFVPGREKVRRALGCIVRSYVGFATIK